MARKEPPAKVKPLPAKQRQFIVEYLIDFNGAAAAVRAGYSEKSARFIARDLLDKPEIQATIDEEKKERAARAGIRADRVLQELAAIAFADPRKIMSWATTGGGDGENASPDVFKMRFLDSKSLPPEAAAAISEISHTRDGFKVKFHSKTKALELLMHHLNLLDGSLGKGGGEEEVPVTTDNVGDLAEKARLRLVANGR